MAGKRRKAPAIEAPQTMTAAIAAADEYAKLEHAMATAELIRDEQIAKAKTLCAELLDDMKPKMAAQHKALQAYFAANEQLLTGGTKRSVTIGPVILGRRTSTPSLKLPKGMKQADAITAILKKRSGGRFIAIKKSLDKSAIMAALKGITTSPASHWLASMGFSLSQSDEFFIKVGEPEKTVEQVDGVVT